MHILWSLQELCAHCSQLAEVLPQVATPIELGLMQKLRQKGGAGQVGDCCSRLHASPPCMYDVRAGVLMQEPWQLCAVPLRLAACIMAVSAQVFLLILFLQRWMLVDTC